MDEGHKKCIALFQDGQTGSRCCMYRVDQESKTTEIQHDDKFTDRLITYMNNIIGKMTRNIQMLTDR